MMHLTFALPHLNSPIVVTFYPCVLFMVLINHCFKLDSFSNPHVGPFYPNITLYQTYKIKRKRNNNRTVEAAIPC